MNKKENRGITLVALVITIIVLIILAGVSINAVMNDGLIDNAKDARNDYEDAKRKEAIALIDLEVQTDFLNAGTPYNFSNGYLTGVEEGTEVGNLNLPTEYKILAYNESTETFELAETTAQIVSGMKIKKGDKEVGRIIIYGELTGAGGINGDDSAYIDFFINDNDPWCTLEDGKIPEWWIIAMDVDHNKIINLEDSRLIDRIFFDNSGEKIEQNVPAPSFDDITIEFGEE